MHCDLFWEKANSVVILNATLNKAFLRRWSNVKAYCDVIEVLHTVYKTSETPKIDNIFIYLRFDYISVVRIN
jgi:hypothetical protein